MKLFNRQGWGRTLLLAAAVIVAAFVAGAFAQTDTAYVRFYVNAPATISATDGTVQIQIQLSSCSGILRLPVLKTTGIADGARRQINAPAIISNRSGKVSVNLPAQSYSGAEVLLYTVNGKRILRYNVSAANSVNISRPNLARGVYLLSVKGTDGGALASRLTHSGGGLNIGVAFGGGEPPSDKRLAKETANGEWTITVSAEGYADSVFTLRPAAGYQERTKEITLRALPGTPLFGTPTNVTATARSRTSVIVSFSEVGGGCVEGYDLYRSASDTGKYERIGGVALYSDAPRPYFTYDWFSLVPSGSGFLDNATFYFKVKALGNGTVGSPMSEYAVGTGGIITDILTDTRDNKTYRTVEIAALRYNAVGYKGVEGTHMWMAEDLNFEPESGSSYLHSRSYDWNTAKTVCPAGWHLPSRQEWLDLFSIAHGLSLAGRHLKSRAWFGESTDQFGLSLSGSGFYESGGRDIYVEGLNTGYWWTATEYTNERAYNVQIKRDGFAGGINNLSKSYRMSVRCVKDE
jgi:uncharacterized protein (TIGR02145 family)